MSEAILGVSGGASGADSGLIETPSRFKQIMTWTAWFYFGFVFLVIFTVMKLPDDRINRYVQGQLANFLAPKGISLTAEKSRLSIGLGISYVMKDVTINLPPPQAPAHLDEVSVSPAIIPLLTGKFGGSVDLASGPGKLTASFSANAKGSAVSASFRARSLDLGKMGILPMLAGVQGSAIINGDGNVSLDTTNLATSIIDVDVDLKNVVFDAQSIQGIAIPKISISEGKISADTEKGKLVIRKLQLGKPNSTADDLRATLTGDATLGRTIDSSTLNVKAIFSISPTILKSLFLVDALLAPGKQPDGSYSFRLSGPMSGLVSTPEPPGPR